MGVLSLLVARKFFGHSDRHDLRELGIRETTKIIKKGVEEAKEQIARKLILGQKGKVVAIRRLRRKIEWDEENPVNLETVFGEGWRLNVPDFARNRGRSLIEDELIQILKDNESLGIRKQLVFKCDIVKDQKPVFAFRIARRAMYALSNELKAASQDRNRPDGQRVGMLEFWGEVFRTEDRMADWVDRVLLGETVSIRHPVNAPDFSQNSSAVASTIHRAVQLLASW